MGTRVPWTFFNKRTSTSFQTNVLSASVNIGRQTYMDVYNGGSLTFTIKNQSNEAAGFAMNDIIQLGAPEGFNIDFWVDEVQFTDYPGNVGLSTATIVCSDAIARLGRNLLVNRSLTLTNCALQAVELNPVSPTEYPRVVNAGTATNFSTASATTYNGAPMTRINQLISTERGILRQSASDVYFYQRGYLSQLSPSGISFGRTGAASTIGYQDFSRVALGMNFMNNVTVTPQGGAEQISENTASVALYGSSYYSVESVDSTNAQGKGLSEWLANSQSDPTALRFEVAFTDQAQPNIFSVYNFLDDYAFVPAFPLTYRVPGAGSSVTNNVILEGFSINITPEVSDFRVFFSPFAYYQFFTLDSATLGVLDTSRLGW
jgi:hypothetical protein